MIWLLTRPIVWPVKTAGYSVAAGYKTGRFFGYRRLSVLLVGVAIGLLVAPFPGKDLRALIKLKLQPPAPPIPLPAAPDVDLTEPAGV
jgi:hypothetical protein